VTQTFHNNTLNQTHGTHPFDFFFDFVI
jgi:hypothetical protein